MKKKIKKDGKAVLYKNKKAVKTYHKIFEVDDEELGDLANSDEKGKKGIVGLHQIPELAEDDSD